MTLMSKVEAEYGIEILRWQRVKDVYHVRSKEHGGLCLKSYDLPFEEVKFIAAVQDHVIHQGFQYVPKTLLTRKNIVGIHANHKWYMLTPWVKGLSPRFGDPRQLRQGVRTLAAFHKCAQDLSVLSIPSRRDKVYGIVKRVEREYDIIRRRYRGECMHALTDLYTASLNLLENSKVQQAFRREAHVKAFVHGDYNYPNIVREGKTRYHLIDFENTSLHVRMEDLAHIIHRNASWQAEKALRMIDQYDHVRPISEGDLSLLIALLFQPYPIIRAMRQRRPRRQHSPISNPSCAVLKRYLHGLQQV